MLKLVIPPDEFGNLSALQLGVSIAISVEARAGVVVFEEPRAVAGEGGDGEDPMQTRELSVNGKVEFAEGFERSAPKANLSEERFSCVVLCAGLELLKKEQQEGEEDEARANDVYQFSQFSSGRRSSGRRARLFAKEC